MLESIIKSISLVGYHTWVKCYIHPKKERIIFVRSKPTVSMTFTVHTGQKPSKPASREN